MSASNKKKLRNEQNAQKLTERQQQEQKEAKKLKLYTTIFVVALAVLLIAAVTLGVSRGLTKSGVLERNTVAATVGEHELSSVELSYFYIDSVLNYYSQVGEYAAFFGLDINTPLDEQIVDEEAGTTRADDFIAGAIADAANVYSIADAAKAAGFELSEDDKASIDTELMYAEFNALYNGGYPSMDSYLKAMYGNGASTESYREYLELRALAGAYYNEYSASLTYTDADLREAEKENFNAYSSYTYNYKYLPVSDYLEGGTADENNAVTYSEEEKAAAREKAEQQANSLVGENVTSVNIFDKLVGLLEGAEAGETSTAVENQLYTSVTAAIRDWVTSADRVEGDTTVIANTSTSTVDGKEVETVNGYYAVYFISGTDNNYPLANVRHILVKPEGGTYNSTTGLYDYNETEMAAAMEEAKELLAQWRAGGATEETFAAMANEHSADGDGTTGGLYEDVVPGQMVEDFNSWCFEKGRKPGNVGLVESIYGVHIMYYVSDSETMYRDYMITEALREADVTEWNNALNEAMTTSTGNTKYLMTDLRLADLSVN